MKQALAANNLPSSLQILIAREEALVLWGFWGIWLAQGQSSPSSWQLN